MSDPLALTLAASAARTASGFGDAVDIGLLRSCARLEFVVAAYSGTQLSIEIETSDSSSTGWRKADVMPPLQGVGKTKTTLGKLARYVRAKWTIAGATPSFTFSVLGVAHVIYAEPGDLSNLAVPEEVLAEIEPHKILEALIASSDEADSDIGNGYTLPLTAWPDVLRMHVSKMALYHLISAIGRQPEGPNDVIDMGYKFALTWLSKLGQGGKAPPGLVDSTPEIEETAGFCISDAKRAAW